MVPVRRSELVEVRGRALLVEHIFHESVCLELRQLGIEYFRVSEASVGWDKNKRLDKAQKRKFSIVRVDVCTKLCTLKSYALEGAN